MPDENKRRLVEMLAARDIPLIEDDIYGDLGFGPARPKAAKAWDNDGERAALLVVLQDALAGLPRRLGRPGRWQAQVERQKVVDEPRHAPADAARRGRVPGRAAATTTTCAASAASTRSRRR